ncbi:apicomplexan CP 15/60K like protein [Cryptosporidium ryanae]|uniref:apicomplexan CP 15/60K like protein n=1 Tax=Cryptosporidium ryanae TaxID=515981 RepID=UPI00351A1FDA|nr:apicomplexan CP 15/60K like protein [Cryptosporidium ryanae]
MLNDIFELFQVCCEFKKSSNESEYIFVFCPVPDDLSDRESDLEGVVKRKYEKVEGTSTILTKDGIVRHWKGREVGSCGCCHLIYEDENIFEKVDVNNDYDNYLRNNLLRKHIEKNKIKARDLDKNSSCSSIKSVQESISATNADSSDDSSPEDKVRPRKKEKVKKTPAQIEKELDIIEEKRYKNQVLKNKEKKSFKDEDDCKQSESDKSQTKKEIKKEIQVNTNENKRGKYLKSATHELYKSSKSFAKLGKREELPPRKVEIIEKGGKSSLNKNDSPKKHMNVNRDVSEKTEQKSLSNSKDEVNLEKIRDLEDSNQSYDNSQRVDEKVDDNVQSNVVSSKVISSNNSLVEHCSLTSVEGNNENEVNSNEGDCITSDSGHTERQFEEEEVNFTRDVPTRIMRKMSITSLKASIILKDGTLLECEVVFSTSEEDLSFICGGKVKAVPWKNIKDVFATKEKLKLVNTRISLSKDPTLIVALQLVDTGNCIPLRFGSKEDKREFIEFSKSYVK